MRPEGVPGPAHAARVKIALGTELGFHNGGVQLGSTLVSLCGLRATKECIRARVSPKCSCPRLASLGTAEAGVRPKLTGLRAMASCTGPDS